MSGHATPIWTFKDDWSYNVDSYTLTHAPRSMCPQQQQLWWYVSSSVNATFTWMKRSHYRYREHRVSEPGLRSVRMHPLRSVILQRDPDFGSAPEHSYQVYEKGRQPAP
jgi:hypothetical protein